MQVSLKRGLTVVELLVVVSILGVLISLLLPAVQMARDAARRISCSNNEKQLALSLHAHEAAFGLLPPTVSSERYNSLLYWQARSLEFLERQDVLDRVREQISAGINIYNNQSRRVTVPSLQCASNPDQGYLVNCDIGFLYAFTDYCGVAGANIDDGIFPLNLEGSGTRFREITNGLSNTLLFGERPPSDGDHGFGAWTGGQNSYGASTYLLGSASNFDTYSFFRAECQNVANLSFGQGKRGGRCDWTHHWSFHAGGANFAKADGSVSFLSYGIDRETLSEQASRN